MKYIALSIVFLLHTCFGLSQNNSVKIEGQILGYDGNKNINFSISSAYGGGNTGSVKPDSLGRFTIVDTIDDLEFFFMYYSDNGVTHTCKLILRPGESYSFISTGYDSDKWEAHYSPDIYKWISATDFNRSYFKIDYGHSAYNLIDNGTSGHLYREDWDLLHPEELISSLRDKNRRQLNQFQKLLDSGEIDNDFFDISKLNIEYTNAYRLAVTINGAWESERFRISDTVITKKLLDIYPTLFELYPVKGVNMEHHFCFERYVDIFLTYLADCDSGQFKPITRRGASAVKPRLKSKKYLSEVAYKNYHLSKTMSYGASLGLNSDQIAKTFIEDNPDIADNKATFLLENIIIPNAEAFYKLSDEDLPEKAVLIDETDTINSFNDLCKVLNGKPFLIDLWGTWCGPCRYQFQFQDTLKPFLEKYDIQMVYIASEYGESREKWKNFIKAYNLEGYHFISNDSFKKDLQNYAGQIKYIPTYIIVDSFGNVVESNAFMPSQTDELFKQLKDKLKL